jgi:2-iminobutanoate/2-iminopropanoate deaminase
MINMMTSCTKDERAAAGMRRRSHGRMTKRLIVYLHICVVLLAGCATAPQPVYHTLPGRATLDLPYSDAVRVGNLLFLAGAVGTAPGTRQLVPGGVVAETRQVLENIRTNLETHGSSMDRAVKCTVFLADIKDFEAMNGVYREFFPRNRPARTTVGVAGLPLGARVEIECIASVR